MNLYGIFLRIPEKSRIFTLVKQEVNDISSAIQSLVRDMESMRKSMDEMSRTISAQSRTIDRQTVELIKLRRENKELKKCLGDERTPQPPKNSGNSSVPPSKEQMSAEAVRRTKSLRKKSKNTPGGQFGHQGSTLKKSDSSDSQIVHDPGHCSLCGADLSSAQSKLEYTTQVIDIPLATPTVTEHRYYSKLCNCGCLNRISKPQRGNSVTYGKNIRAVIVYLSVVQCLPYKRLVSTLKAFYGIEPSEGTVNNIIEQAMRSSQPALDKIKSNISAQRVVGFDETGCYCRGKLDWAWIAQTPTDTYVFRANGRGHECLEAEFGDKLQAMVAVSDRHSAYFAIDFANHQVCLAHLLRNLEYLNELDKTQKWSSKIQNLLRDAIKARHTNPGKPISTKYWLDKLDKLLQKAVGHLHEDFIKMKNALNKCRNFIFNFLADPAIPPTNNDSERGFRKTKVKQKISGAFRSEDGADAFFAIHSIADSALKKGMSPFEAILALW